VCILHIASLLGILLHGIASTLNANDSLMSDFFNNINMTLETSTFWSIPQESATVAALLR
jgi:hypothetical protein